MRSREARGFPPYAEDPENWTDDEEDEDDDGSLWGTVETDQEG